MFPVLRIGHLAIQAPGLMLVAGLFLGVTLNERIGRRRGENPDTLTNLVLLIGLAGLLAARIFFVLGHLAYFRADLPALISPDPGLLDGWGGLVGAVVAALIYARRKQLTLWPTLDRLTPFLAVLAVFVGLAHIASGQAYGAPTSLPWAIDLWGARRHPSQFYETAGAILILALLWRQFSVSVTSGKLFLRFVALTAGMAVFLCAFRGDSRLALGSFRQEQLLALIVFGLALLFLEIRSRPAQS